MMHPDPVVDYHAFYIDVHDEVRALDVVIHAPAPSTEGEGHNCKVDCPAINKTDCVMFYGQSPRDALRHAETSIFHGLNIHVWSGAIDERGQLIPLPDIDIVQY